MDISVSDALTVSESRTIELNTLVVSTLDSVAVSGSVSMGGPSNAATVEAINVYDIPYVQIEALEFPEELVDIPDLDRIYLVELEIGREIELETWTASGGAYYCSFDPNVFGEVFKVLVDSPNASYAKADSIASCQGSASSFFYDFPNKRLYLHMVDSDSPSTLVDTEPKYCIIAYFWVCLTNRQPKENRTIYAPQGLTNEVYYLPYLNSDSMPPIEQSVGDFYKSDLRIQFGTVSFVNDGWWYQALETMLWHNAKTYIKVGTKGETYNHFTTILVGIARTPTVNDESATLEISDARTNTLAEIPVTFYPTIDESTGLPVPNEPAGKYLYLEPSASGRPIPVPFGYCRGIQPVCLDPAEAIFKVADYPIEDIVAVYENDVKLYPPVLHDGETAADFLPATAPEYSLDLEHGEFTLLQDFADHVIKCDVKGVKCGPQTPPLYSEKVADIALFILRTLNGLSDSEIDASSFNTLREERQQKIGYNVDSLTDSLELLRLLQASAVFQLFPARNGIWFSHVYETGSDNALIVRKEDISALGIEYDTNGIFWQVQVKYRKDPATGEFLVASASDDKVKYRYKESKVLEVQTALYDTNEAMVLAQFLLNLVKVPPKTIKGDIGIEGFGRTPTEKIKISKTIVDGEGNSIVLFEDAVYRVLEFRKDLGPSKTGIVGLDDSISLGAAHVDAAEYHDHGDSYIDIDHEQSAHSDYEHTNTTHADVEHVDLHDDLYNDYWPTIDEEHWEYADHDDCFIHSDNGHWDYNDTHLLRPNAHSDYNDAHGDIHVDHFYGDEALDDALLWHADTHSDVAHQNSGYDDHGDSPEVNVPAQDWHEQTYNDTPHGDAHF